MSKKYHIIYKTINSINGRFYIGMHSTNDLNDGYYGSGLWLRNAIRKYGINNFKREILFFLDSRKLAFSKEQEIVTSDFIKNNKVYNINTGGVTGKKIQIYNKEGNNYVYNHLLIKPYKNDVYIKIDMKFSDYMMRFRDHNIFRLILARITFPKLINTLERMLNNSYQHDYAMKRINDWSYYFNINLTYHKQTQLRLL